MTQIWNIAKQQLLIMFKDRSSFFWMIILPCMYIFVFGNAFRQNFDRSAYKATLGIYNQDSGYLSAHLESYIESESIEIVKLDSIPENLPPRYMEIPSDFTQKLLNKEKTVIGFKNKPDANMEAGAAATIAVKKAVLRLLANISHVTVKQQTLSTESLVQVENLPPLVTINASYAGHHITIPTGYHQQVPANVVMITMIMGFLFGATTLVEERRNGILRRIRIAPVTAHELFLGKLLGVTIIAMIQIIVLLIVGRFVFGVYFGNDLLALLFLIIGFAFTVGAMGLILGFLIKEEEKVNAIAIILALAMAAISGCWWPIEIAPGWMQQVALVLPSGIALKALHDLISFGNGIETIWPELIKLLLYAIAFTVIASRLMPRSDS